jgi:hypothetical protein
MPAPPCGNYGDVSGDGDVSGLDTLLVAKHLAGDRLLTSAQLIRADVDGDGTVTQNDADLISQYAVGSIKTFPVCGTGTTPPPGTETKTTSLAEGTHNIVITLAGYEEFKARINVGSSSVTCVRISGNAACGGSSLPRLNVTGTWEVTAHMKTGTGGTARCTWVGTQNTESVNFISDMVLAYNNLKDIGFVPSASEIGNGVLMYSKLGTPTSLWGC